MKEDYIHAVQSFSKRAFEQSSAWQSRVHASRLFARRWIISICLLSH
jgi:hypothetical protein